MMAYDASVQEAQRLSAYANLANFKIEIHLQPPIRTQNLMVG
jgi:hypothetical protein